jgi:hypothetical protein
MAATASSVRVKPVNIARRHLNKGQIAIVVAKAHPDTDEVGGRGKKSVFSIGFPMVNPLALSQARTIVRYAPELAAEVRDRRLAAGLGVATAAFFRSSRARWRPSSRRLLPTEPKGGVPR